MADQSHKILLIVEDEKALRGVLHDRLAHEGFDVFEAKNGQEGLDTAMQHKPNLILLDIVMPVMDGMTMLKKLRDESEWGKKVPVIILTNLSSADDQMNKNITKLEPSFYLVKIDWKIDDVVLKIKELLQK